MAFLSLLTAPLSLLWATVSWVRGKCFDWGWLPSTSFPLPVICVGNLAVGGTGKTPHVEYLLRMLHGEGYRVAMLSRGYGRKSKGFRWVQAESTAREVGDEPLQMARNCPFATVAVCERRVEGIRQLLASNCPPQVIVLDDAYQHRYVQAGLNILLTDASRLYTQDHLLPWGRLRESAAAARRADVVIVTKCQSGQYPPLAVEAYQQLYYSEIIYASPYPLVGKAPTVAPSVKGRRMLLVVGIANPVPLRRYLEAQGVKQIEVLAFPDHHRFGEADARQMTARWESLLEAAGTDEVSPWVMTTQKDATRLHELLPLLPSSFQQSVYVQPITVEVKDVQRQTHTFQQKIINYVIENSRNCCMD